MVKEQKKSLTQVHKIGMWADAPQSTFLSRFLEEGFTLIEFEPIRFNYDQNEYFQYYMKVKDSYNPLESENADQDRVNIYDNLD